LFLSDSPPELDAARSVTMQTALVARTPVNETQQNGHPIINSFDEVG